MPQGSSAVRPTNGLYLYLLPLSISVPVAQEICYFYTTNFSTRVIFIGAVTNKYITLSHSYKQKYSSRGLWIPFANFTAQSTVTKVLKKLFEFETLRIEIKEERLGMLIAPKKSTAAVGVVHIGTSTQLLLFTYILTCIFIYLLAWLLTYLLHRVESFLKGVLSQSSSFSHFIEPKVSLPHSQFPATCPYPEPARFSP